MINRKSRFLLANFADTELGARPLLRQDADGKVVVDSNGQPVTPPEDQVTPVHDVTLAPYKPASIVTEESFKPYVDPDKIIKLDPEVFKDEEVMAKRVKDVLYDMASKEEGQTILKAVAEHEIYNNLGPTVITSVPGEGSRYVEAVNVNYFDSFIKASNNGKNDVINLDYEEIKTAYYPDIKTQSWVPVTTEIVIPHELSHAVFTSEQYADDLSNSYIKTTGIPTRTAHDFFIQTFLKPPHDDEPTLYSPAAVLSLTSKNLTEMYKRSQEADDEFKLKYPELKDIKDSIVTEAEHTRLMNSMTNDINKQKDIENNNNTILNTDLNKLSGMSQPERDLIAAAQIHTQEVVKANEAALPKIQIEESPRIIMTSTVSPSNPVQDPGNNQHDKSLATLHTSSVGDHGSEFDLHIPLSELPQSTGNIGKAINDLHIGVGAYSLETNNLNVGSVYVGAHTDIAPAVSVGAKLGVIDAPTIGQAIDQTISHANITTPTNNATNFQSANLTLDMDKLAGIKDVKLSGEYSQVTQKTSTGNKHVDFGSIDLSDTFKGLHLLSHESTAGISVGAGIYPGGVVHYKAGFKIEF